MILTDKSDGNMRAVDPNDAEEVAKNYEKLASEISLPMKQIARIRSVYDTDNFLDYVEANDPSNRSLSDGESMERSDGILTTRKGMGIFLPIADCLGIVLYDSFKKALMVVHSGRHNIEQCGAEKAVQFMSEKIGSKPEDILAWFSPSAGKNNYPLQKIDGKSLQEVAYEQLQRSGVKAENITLSDVDTTMHERYFSHSGVDKTKRFAVLAFIKKELE